MMKKYLYLLLCATFILCSCSKDESDVNPQLQPQSESDIEEDVKLSDFEILESQMVETDSEGNILEYSVGANLNEADPSEISVPVDTYEEAVALFKSWLPEGAQLVEEYKKITWKMTDEDNQEEGETILMESNNPGEVAILTITVAPQSSKETEADAKIVPVITRVKFIQSSAWPENSSEMEEYLEEYYYLGAEIQVTKNEGAGTGTYVVIREWTPQEAGIMIRFEDKTYHYSDDDYDMEDCSSPGTTQTVSKVLHQGNNYEYFVNIYGKQHNWPDLHNRFITTKTKKYFLGLIDYYFVRLDSGKCDKFSRNPFKNPSYKKVFIYWFKPNGNAIKIW